MISSFAIGGRRSIATGAALSAPRAFDTKAGNFLGQGEGR
jgi:hypothetical protein